MELTVKEKLVKARTGLVLDHPFFGSLVLRLVPEEVPSFPTMFTDGKRLGYNPKWVEGLSLPQLKGILCHEVLHCALNHMTRRGDRDARTWNIAGDYAINGMIREIVSLPAGHLFNPDFDGLSAEDIYSRIPKGGPDKDGHDKGKGGGQEDQGGMPDSDPGGCGAVKDSPGKAGDPASASNFEAQAADWAVATAQAAQAARSQGKLPAGLERMVDEILNPKVDWISMLQRFMMTAAKSDYSWSRPNRRFIHAGLYLPSCYSLRMDDVIIGVDTSGSISRADLARAAAEISAVCSDVGATVHVVYCDSEISGVETFGPADLPLALRPKGGGGTDFRPVFDWAEDRGERPSCLIYFTDLMGAFPEVDPGYPVLWAVVGGQDKVPFGEVLSVE